MHGNCNLLEIPARNAGEYARAVLKKLFTADELKSGLLPSQQSKRYSKPELDHERINCLNGKRLLLSCTDIDFFT